MPLALSRTGVVFKKCYINDAGDFSRLARNVYKVCVPKTSSTLSDQAVFVDQATDTRLFPDAVLLEIDRFG